MKTVSAIHLLDEAVRSATETLCYETEMWLAKVIRKGPGWRLWRSPLFTSHGEECDEIILTYEFKLLKPGEEPPRDVGVIYEQPTEPENRDRAAVNEGTTVTQAFLLVKIAGAKPPVYLVVDYPIYKHDGEVRGEEECEEHMRYFVESHTCPTNLVEIEAFLWEDDSDPHGVLEYVAHVAKPEDWPDGATYDQWCELFPMLPGGIVDTRPILLRRLEAPKE